MTRRRVLLVLAHSLAGLTACALGSRFARAAEHAQRVMRLCLVAPDSPSTAPPQVPVFWERLHELGWVEGHLAAKHRLPAMYTERVYVEAGGLMSYAPDIAVQFRHEV